MDGWYPLKAYPQAFLRPEREASKASRAFSNPVQQTADAALRLVLPLCTVFQRLQIRAFAGCAESSGWFIKLAACVALVRAFRHETTEAVLCFAGHQHAQNCSAQPRSREASLTLSFSLWTLLQQCWHAPKSNGDGMAWQRDVVCPSQPGHLAICCSNISGPSVRLLQHHGHIIPFQPCSRQLKRTAISGASTNNAEAGLLRVPSAVTFLHEVPPSTPLHGSKSLPCPPAFCTGKTSSEGSHPPHLL